MPEDKDRNVLSPSVTPSAWIKFSMGRKGGVIAVFYTFVIFWEFYTFVI